MIKLYILLGVILFYILFVIYCKVFYRFWSTQPVFHLHNLYYWIFPPGIIQHSAPPLTKFYDPKVQFYFWNALSAKMKEQFYHLNKKFYLQNDIIAYKPTKESIFSYFEKHNDPCFIALLFESDPLFHYSKQSIIPRQKCIASLTSRPLNVYLHGKLLKVNYVDYLCVAKQKRKQGVAPRMIYSYYYQSRRKHDTLAYLFKREGVGTFITPLTVYMTYGFTMKSIPSSKIFPPLLINSSSFTLFYHYMKTIKSSIPCFIHPSFSHIKHLVEKKLLYIFLLMDNNTPYGCYVFRNPHTHYEKGGESLDCIASYCSSSEKIANFIGSFSDCLSQISYPFNYLLIENISHNDHLIQYMMMIQKPFLKSNTSYYLYNFGYRPFISKEVFLLS